MEQFKQDPFFKGVDWGLLAKKQVPPPEVLKKVAGAKDKQQKKQKEEETLEMMFEDGLEVDQSALLTDKDYEEHNQTYNRVKNYSFVRQS